MTTRLRELSAEVRALEERLRQGGGTAKVAKLKCAVYEVPISYYGRTYQEGKKIGMRDGIAAFWYLARFNLFTGLRSSFRTMPELEDPKKQKLLLDIKE